MERARSRFRSANLKEAKLRTGRSQTKIRIWLVKEVAAMDKLKTSAGEPGSMPGMAEQPQHDTLTDSWEKIIR